MSLPTSEPVIQDDDNLSPARRRRKNRRIVPQGTNNRLKFLKELTHQATPAVEQYVLAVLSAIVLAAAILSDSPAFYMLATMLAPFMAPVVGLALATIIGSLQFFFQSLIGMLITSAVVFLGGVLTGLFVQPEPSEFTQAYQLAYVSVPDFLVLAFGAAVTIYQLVRNPERKPLISNAALVYEILLPLGVAGFGLTSQIPDLFSTAMVTFLLHTGLATLIGAIVLGIVGLRPNDFLGYLMSGALILLCVVGAVAINGSIQLPEMPHLEAAVLPTSIPTEVIATLRQSPTDPAETEEAATLTATTKPSPTATTPPQQTPTTPEPTETSAPTATPTQAPTVIPQLGMIAAKEGNGARFRTSPYFSAEAVADPYATLLNDTYVSVFETVENEDGTWAHIRLISNKEIEGWVLRSLISIEEE
ncbi:MAG: DUF389 domain-containing protein [Anaerolineaceae bacterium]|nr:DUF389 domain-containing protein [Anaerolineaceae bacterium]